MVLMLSLLGVITACVGLMGATGGNSPLAEDERKDTIQCCSPTKLQQPEKILLALKKHKPRENSSILP